STYGVAPRLPRSIATTRSSFDVHATSSAMFTDGLPPPGTIGSLPSIRRRSATKHHRITTGLIAAMSRSSVASLLSAHLGIPTHVSGLVATRTFRSITVTYHRVRDGSWLWAPSSGTRIKAAMSSTVVLFPLDGGPVPTASDAPSEPTSVGLFLPPTAEVALPWRPGAEVLAVWVPELLLREFREGGVDRKSVV